MVGCRTELSDGVAVFSRWVALVAMPVILWIFLGKFVHIVVAVGLCEYAGGGNGEIFPIALHYCGMWQVVIGLEPVSVNYYCLWAHLQLVEGSVHGKY